MELLSVIVVLAIILVIAVPSIMSTITESKKGSLSSSAKIIASGVESAMIANQALGIEKNITCEDVSSYTEDDYTCDLKFADGKVKVSLIGKGKFEGMAVCFGTKEAATVVEDCTPKEFKTDSWDIIADAVKKGNISKYNVGDTKEIDLGIELGTHIVRIANKSTCPTGENVLASETACGFVIEFADVITTHVMKSNNFNEGGWKKSEMRTYLNTTIYNVIVSKIGNIIKDTIVVLGRNCCDSPKVNYTTTDKLYLLSTREV